MKFYIILFIVLFSSAVTADENSYIGCFQTITPETKNTATLCANRRLATATVYYPNKGGTPTVCSQYGYSTSNIIKKVVSFELKEGSCKNNRIIESSNIDCKFLKNNKVECKHSPGYTLTYKRLDN